jgi:hypothetical protein
MIFVHRFGDLEIRYEIILMVAIVCFDSFQPPVSNNRLVRCRDIDIFGDITAAQADTYYAQAIPIAGRAAMPASIDLSTINPTKLYRVLYPATELATNAANLAKEGTIDPWPVLCSGI